MIIVWAVFALTLYGVMLGAWRTRRRLIQAVVRPLRIPQATPQEDGPSPVPSPVSPWTALDEVQLVRLLKDSAT